MNFFQISFFCGQKTQKNASLPFLINAKKKNTKIQFTKHTQEINITKHKNTILKKDNRKIHIAKYSNTNNKAQKNAKIQNQLHLAISSLSPLP